MENQFGQRRQFIGAMATLGLVTTGPLDHRSAGPRDSDGNVRRYGAKGDGKSDDTRAIQSAIDAANGIVYFPKGVYRITRTIDIELDKLGFTAIYGDGTAAIVMAGAGPAFRFRGTHEKSADPKGFADNVWTRQRMPVVDNIGIVGDHPESVGVEAVGTMQLTITRLHVRKALHGIHLRGNNRNLAVADCHLYENRGTGIFYDDVNLHQSNITGCHISYNGGGGIVSRGGNVRNIHITGCDIESNMGRDMPATANVLIDCWTSQWGTAEVAITGCTIQHNAYGPDSANVRIIGGSDYGNPPRRRRWGNINITGNIFSDVMVNVHLVECRGVTISGNTFWEGFDHHMLLEKCRIVAIGPNVFDTNDAYARDKVAMNNVKFSECEDCTITGLQVNYARGDAAVALEKCHRMNLSHCNITNSEKVGLMLTDLRDSVVMGCVIRNDNSTNTRTMVMEGGEGNVVKDNLA